jgi:hypothetical protein
MKFSWQYVKQNPVMFGVIFVVFGLLLWVLINRRSGGGAGNVVYQQAGKDPNQVAAEAAIAQAQIQAQAQTQAGQLQLAAIAQQGQTELALANLQGQVSLAELGASERLGFQSMESSLAALRYQLEADRSIVDSNNAFQIGYARVAADSAVETVRINAELQQSLSNNQLQAYQYGAFVATIPSLRRRDRDDVLRLASPVGTGYTAAGMVNPASAERNNGATALLN